ncbi:NAD(P)H-dependent glycerol-3-phosphate dehydrogenase [Methyloferula stellata]|uniref:NAD(P)H-dependent glycerol-3-phosphate dehydrogenase n=1 Tax=Methyloferula stellata TaxID=876270 RepID=UPI00037ADFE3|nr:NAD(P)H-dependent glycerol-3-phosphate dehydrogenase [Methyloferula stellata]
MSESNSPIAVLGAGAWGTALANLAAYHGTKVVLWGRDPQQIAAMAAEHVNARHLPGVPLAPSLDVTADLAAIAGASLILAAVPAQALRGAMRLAAPHISAGVPVIICAKGIERTSGLFLSDVLAEVLPQNPAAVLSGPGFAQDVGKGLPTAITLAAKDAALAERLGQRLAVPWVRFYHSSDVRGVEIGGAAKNVLAIAVGIAAGRGLGASACAALIARGFAELTRFGAAFGAEPGTLMGLSGLGDLVLTCGSAQSRNYAFGLALGRGTPMDQAVAAAGLVEGAYTSAVLVSLAQRKGVDMPIATAVDAVLTQKLSIDAAIEALLARPAKPERLS